MILILNISSLILVFKKSLWKKIKKVKFGFNC